MHSADIKAITEAYQSIYAQEEIVELTEELLDESFDELVDELIEEGYEEEEALSLLEDATDAYLEEAKVTFGHDTTARRASGAPVGARRKYGKRKAGEALKAAGSAVKSAADSAKKKASAVKAGAEIAGSIAKDEARRAGRKAAHAVTSAPGKAKAAVDRKKQETKRGIKGFIKRQAEKVVKRMSEGAKPFSGGSGYPMRDAMKDAGMNRAPHAPVKKAQKKPTTQMAGYELEGEQLAERLKATGVFSEQEIEAIMENIMKGPLLPGEGRPTYPAGQAPKPTGAKLPLAKKSGATTQMAGYEPEGEIVEGYVSVEDGVIYLEGNQGPSTPVRIYTFPDGSKRVQPYVGGAGAVPRKGLVKKVTKPTTQTAGYEPEGEMIDENLLKKLRRFNPGAAMANQIQRSLIPPVADGTLDTAARNASPRGTRPKVKTEAFDYILDYLVKEGFAKTEDSAKAIMSNMSEAWIKSILEQAPPPPFLPNSNDSPEVQTQKRKEHNKKHSNYTGAGLGNRPVDGTGTGP